ncbi:winged helix-turn-helix domain-containing protein [Pseudomonas sp. SWRI79]|uniref:Winged helix-turn-helix domain-containing protein n=1 Tax=Pseudomonas farris TaxID=2841207 RepID=A0ABS6PZJ1_9PSED|nr:winged helix-turn-helix domain-containing protein [Pseudomonas farris]MBV4465878.1 winged helix-turn-helix domain-containing protein [Pseudomonas farris]
MLRLTKDVSLDTDLNKISNGENIFPITEKEKQLLLALWEHAQEGNVLSREQLIPLVWPERKNGVEESNLLQLICKLRRTLRYCELGEAIHTVYRQGYRFILPPDDDEQIKPDDRSSEETELPPPRIIEKKPKRYSIGRTGILLMLSFCAIYAYRLFISFTEAPLLVELQQLPVDSVESVYVTRTINGYDLCFKKEDNTDGHMTFSF